MHTQKSWCSFAFWRNGHRLRVACWALPGLKWARCSGALFYCIPIILKTPPVVIAIVTWYSLKGTAMARVLFWYVLERLVSIPARIIMPLHEFLIRKVTESVKRAEDRHAPVDMPLGKD